MLSRAKILIVEDQLEVQHVVQTILGTKYELTTASNLKSARQALESTNFDLLILDGGLPDGDGFNFFSELRNSSKYADLCVVFLTSRVEVDDRIAAFEMGADDYIVKPFEHREFQARIAAKVARVTSRRNCTEFHGLFCIDTKHLRIYLREDVRGQIELPLTTLEFRLLSIFLRSDERTLTRSELIKAAWGDSVHILDRTVDRHVSSLRKKIGSAAKIESVQGVGYRYHQVGKAESGIPI